MQICIPSAMLCSLHIWIYKFLHKFYLNWLFLFAIDIRLFTHFPHQSRQIFKLHCQVDGLEYTCINIGIYPPPPHFILAPVALIVSGLIYHWANS